MNKFIVCIIFALSSLSVYTQNIELKSKEKPLNELLIEWRERYDLQFSFNDDLLSKFTISQTQTYTSADKAIEGILKGLPLQYEKSDNVYIIFALEANNEPRIYHLIGKIIEKGTNEPLPFSHVSANDLQAVTDIKGVFSFTFENDSVYQVKASHLGCYIIDTVLMAGQQHTLSLTPSVVGLPEIRVTNNIVEKSAQIGEQPGLTKLNHHIANYLPGNGDNSVFNLLKLQPGIAASGENPNDLILWGSSEGTSIVQFDGFTIWGLKNLNDNISSVNPFMAKSVDILKGGYDATQSDFIGGIVNISGKNGNTANPAFHFFLNNQTINSMLELPIGRKSSVVATYRQNYYNLISSSDVQVLEINNISQFQWDYKQPDYTFRDLNFKYSLQGDNGDLFYISMLAGGDELGLEGEKDTLLERTNRDVLLQHLLQVKESTKQYGASAFYGKTFSNGNSSSINLSLSSFDIDYNIKWYRSIGNNTALRYERDASNTVLEAKADWQNQVLINNKNKLTTGLSLMQNNTKLLESQNTDEQINLTSHASRVVLYAQNQYNINREVRLNAGFRFNYPTHITTTYFDPRISLSYKPGLFKFNASWGIYHQFIARTSIVDDNNRIRYAWYVSGYNDVPVLKSEHWVLGTAYAVENFLFSVDTYFKRNKNLTRYIRFAQANYISDGQSKSYGLDLYAKQDFNGHSVWASYSLAKTEELYDYFPTQEYRRAPQDQRHEFKLAGLLNFGSFHLSASYIYGSGFPLFTDNVRYEFIEPDYNRTDLSVIYKISGRKVAGEIGLSVLNVFNNENVKYNSFQLIPVDEFNSVLVNQEAMPFTPLLHLKISI